MRRITKRLLRTGLVWLSLAVAALVTQGQTPASASPSPSPSGKWQGLIGKWQGALTVGAGSVRVTLNILEPAAGQLSSTLDLPDNGANGLPVEHVSYTDRILTFDVNIGAPSRYEGAISRDTTEMFGHLQQGGNYLPLRLTRSNATPDAAAAKPAILANARRKVDLRPCDVPGVTKDALCAQYEVFEDRAKTAGRKIKLNLMILPALVDRPAPDPIVYLLGGPGGAATSAAPAWIMTQLRRTRDVVLLDQRGTGKSNPLNCNFRGESNDMSRYFINVLTPEAISACRAELEKNADLRLYTTTIAMADLDEVIGALGYDKVNVYGGSYGATTALAYLNYYPRRVRTVTISGVAPPDVSVLVPFGKAVDHALNRLFEDCAAEEKCHTAFPDLRKDWATVVANVGKGPVTFDTLNPATRQKQQITMTREGFAELVRLALYIPNIMSIMPVMIHQMSAGDYSQFAYYAYQAQKVMEGGIARGMHFSVLCAEDMPFTKDSEIDAAMAGTFYGGFRAHLFIKICEQWPRGEMPAKFREPIKSDLPVLILSGELDPVTPPELATPLLRWLPNGRQILMHNATHYPYECQEKLARDFIDRGTAKGLDASCVEGIKRPLFITTLPPLAIPK